MLSFLFELFAQFLNIINLALLGFTVQLFESNQLFSFCTSFFTVPKSWSMLYPQPSRFVSPAYKIVVMLLETSQTLFRHQINSNVPTLSLVELHIHLFSS